MNRRNEEKLINLAFGELSQEEAAALQAQMSADPKTARLLSDYRQIKTDLPRLNDIPEMQLSGDRLRDAILQRGLKKTNRWPLLGWMVAPGLAALLAVALFVHKPEAFTPQSTAQSAEPKAEAPVADMVAMTAPMKTSVFAPDTEVTNPHKAIRSDISYGSSEPAVTEKAAPAPAPPAETEVSAPVVHHLSSMKSHGPRVDEQPVEAAPAPAVVAVAEPPVTEPADTAVAADFQPTVDDVALLSHDHSEKMVVVDPSKDSSTGAQKATEVSSSTDVMVGG